MIFHRKTKGSLNLTPYSIDPIASLIAMLKMQRY